MSSKKNPPAHPVTPDTRVLPLYDAIARQAEKLWKRYGCPDDRDDEIWQEAERQVLGADAETNQQPQGGAIPAGPLGDVLYPPVQPQRGGEGEARSDGQMGAPGADTGLPK